MKNNSDRHKWSFHRLMMIGCILIAVVALARIFILGSAGINGAFLIMLLCPLMHLLMMRHGSHSSKNESDKETNHTNNSCH